MNEKKNKRSAPRGRGLLIFLCIFLTLVLVVLVAGVGYVEYTLNKIPRATEPETTLSQEQIQNIENGEDEEEEQEQQLPTLDPEETLPQDTPEDIKGEHLVNILLIGQDRRPGEGRARSDAMILCTFNLEKKTLTMTSFLRDLYVQIPGYQDNRINAAYALGGMELLNKTLEVNFGIHVDGNVEVDFSEFETLIDLLGGVDINLTNAEANHLGLYAGVNHLDGTTALKYARIRKLDSDFGRTNRQRTVLNALIQAYKNKPLTEMMALLDDILPIVTTDMKNSEIISYVVNIFPMLAQCEVRNQHIPADGTYRSVSIRGMSVLYPDLEANRQILQDTLMDDT